MDPTLVAIIEDYLRAHGMNVPPPQIISDTLAAPGSSIDNLLAVLGMAANLGDPADNAEAEGGQAERDAYLGDAETKFPANEEQAAQMMQSLPQTASGLAASVGGAFTGLLQGLAQIPQQVTQGAEQALQAGLGAAQQGIGSGAEFSLDPLDDELGDDLAGDLGWANGAGGGASGGGGGGGFEGTAPTGYLGPPPTPAAGTVPASAQTQTAPAAAPGPSGAAAGPRGGMGAMPLMPPGAMHGGATDGDGKGDTKRVVAPSVKNGAPVQGRITAPPPPPVTKRVDGKPVATRRVLVPGKDKPED